MIVWLQITVLIKCIVGEASDVKISHFSNRQLEISIIIWRFRLSVTYLWSPVRIFSF